MKSLALIAALLAPALSPALSPKEIYQARSPGVAMVLAEFPGGGLKRSTALLLDGRGHLLASRHALRDARGVAAKSVSVRFLRGKAARAALPLREDAGLDLALLRCEGAPKASALAFGSEEALGPGDAVAVIGHPEQGAPWSLGAGMLSGSLDDFQGVPGRGVWQLDAGLNPGHSGAPVFDARGLVIGVAQAVAGNDASGRPLQRVDYALRAAAALAWLRGAGLALKAREASYDDGALREAHGLPGARGPLSPRLRSAPSGIRLSLRPGATSFKSGEPLAFRARSERAVRLVLLHRDAQGALRALLPNAHQGVLSLVPGATRLIPSPEDAFELRAAAPWGEEWLAALASVAPLGWDPPKDGRLGPASLRALEKAWLAQPADERGLAQCGFEVQDDAANP